MTGKITRMVDISSMQDLFISKGGAFMPGYYTRKHLWKRKLNQNKETAIIVAALVLSAAVFGWFLGLWLYTPVGLCETVPETYICTTQKGTWVNVRATPDPNGRIVGTLRYGYEIEPEGEVSGYLKITLNDQPAYVRREFFERPFKARGTVSSRVVTRAKPNGKKLGHLNPGSWIDILAVTTDADGIEWYRCYGNVYIMARYLEVLK